MGKIEADNLERISTKALKKHGFLKGLKSGTMTWTNSGLWGESKNSVSIVVSTLEGDSYLRIYYTQRNRNTDEKTDFDYKIPLTSTPCRYGGNRYWFICPWYKNGVYCGKRVGTLYKDGDYFACRHCYALTYRSRNQNRRNGLFHLFSIITLEDELEEILGKVKRTFYRGKLTKKMEKFERLQARRSMDYRQYIQLEKRKML